MLVDNKMFIVAEEHIGSKSKAWKQGQIVGAIIRTAWVRWAKERIEREKDLKVKYNDAKKNFIKY